MERASATLNERVPEVERLMQFRSASPATTVEQNPTFHEDIARLDSRIEAGFQAFFREVDELREESGASAPESSSSQGHAGTAASNRITHTTNSTAPSSSAARAPTLPTIMDLLRELLQPKLALQSSAPSTVMFGHELFV